MFDYYYSINEKVENIVFAECKTMPEVQKDERDFELMAEIIVDEYEMHSEVFSMHEPVFVHFWNDKFEYIGEYIVNIHTTRLYYASKVRN
jgi:hypothetical protein